jgi:xanthine/CO dehydrogenase XdhC/CoxF family maturation factor
MKEIRKILELYDSRTKENKKLALATVVRIEGSSFRRIGARMLIYEDGMWTGGISGGCLEGDILKKAKKVMIKKSNTIITYDTRDGDPYQIGIGLGCRGKIDIFLESIDNAENNTLEKLRRLYETRSAKCIAHVIDINFENDHFQIGKVLTLEESIVQDLIPEMNHDFKAALDSGTTQFKEYDTVSGMMQVLYEVIPERINLFIVGNNYDIPSIVQIANLMEWDIHLLSDISNINKEALTGCSISLQKIKDIPDQLINNRSALLLMSHDYQTDLQILKCNIKKAIPYVGLLGPKSRFDELIGDLRKDGILLTTNDLERIHAPIGLDIGGDTPDSIALSICAEILAFFNRRNGGFLKWRNTKIYDEYRVNKSSLLS